ncbi:MAG: nucleoside diphosphate kinase regulator [Wenzhouxiangella sp.]
MNPTNDRPSLVISSLDAERLEKLLEGLPKSAFAGKADLENELARADIVEPEAIPTTVVTMNSTVRFKVESTGETFTMTLVYPKDVDGSSDKISILAPVGSALLGLSENDQIEWPRPGGGALTVLIEAVVFQPERVGQFHR